MHIPVGPIQISSIRKKKQVLKLYLFVGLVDHVVTVNFDDTIANFQSSCTGWRVRIHFTDKVTFFFQMKQVRNDVINQL